MIARAREQGQLKMVADQRLNPTFTADLAAGLIEAVGKGAQGLFHITNSGSCSWYEFTVEIMRLAEIDVSIEAAATTRGTVDRPLNGVLARPRTDAQGLTPLRSWRDALADYLEPS